MVLDPSKAAMKAGAPVGRLYPDEPIFEVMMPGTWLWGKRERRDDRKRLLGSPDAARPL